MAPSRLTSIFQSICLAEPRDARLRISLFRPGSSWIQQRSEPLPHYQFAVALHTAIFHVVVLSALSLPGSSNTNSELLSSFDIPSCLYGTLLVLETATTVDGLPVDPVGTADDETGNSHGDKLWPRPSLNRRGTRTDRVHPRR